MTEEQKQPSTALEERVAILEAKLESPALRREIERVAREADKAVQELVPLLRMLAERKP